MLRALGDWGERHTSGVPMRVVNAGCGGEVGPARLCSCCGTVVGRDEEARVRPWHSPHPIPLARPVAAQPEELQDQVHLAGQHGQARMRDAAPGGRLPQ